MASGLSIEGDQKLVADELKHILSNHHQGSERMTQIKH